MFASVCALIFLFCLVARVQTPWILILARCIAWKFAIYLGHTACVCMCMCAEKFNQFSCLIYRSHKSVLFIYFAAKFLLLLFVLRSLHGSTMNCMQCTYSRSGFFPHSLLSICNCVCAFFSVRHKWFQLIPYSQLMQLVLLFIDREEKRDC